MNKRQQRFDVLCPTCKTTRNVGYASFWQLNKNKRFECHKCSCKNLGQHLPKWIRENVTGRPGRKKMDAKTRAMYEFPCIKCHSLFSVSYDVSKRVKRIGNYCCRKCGNKGQKGNSGRIKAGSSPWNLGKKIGSQSIELRLKKSETMKRVALEKGWTKNTQDMRKSLEYKLWREAVYKRDDFTCQDCHQRGGRLNADHIKPWSLFYELRFAIDNGRTLCEACHRKTPTWGFRVFNYQPEKTTNS